MHYLGPWKQLACLISGSGSQGEGFTINAANVICTNCISISHAQKSSNTITYPIHNRRPILERIPNTRVSFEDLNSKLLNTFYFLMMIIRKLSIIKKHISKLKVCHWIHSKQNLKTRIWKSLIVLSTLWNFRETQNLHDIH